MFPPLRIFIASGARKSLLIPAVRFVAQKGVEAEGQGKGALEEKERIPGVDRRPRRLLVGDAVPVVHEFLTEGLQMRHRGVADFAGIAVFAGEGGDGRGRLDQAEGRWSGRR